MNYLVQFKEKLGQYYEIQIYSLLNQIARPIWAGVVLLLFRFYLHIQLMVSKNMGEELSSVDSNLKKVVSQSLFVDKFYAEGIFYAGVIITGLFIIALLNDFLCCQYKVFIITSHVSRVYIGAFSSIYSYALFVPLFYFSLDQLYQDNLVALYAVPITFLIGLLICLHDQDYSIYAKDSLANRISPKISFLYIILESSACIMLRYEENPKVMLLISLGFSIFKVYQAFSKRNYENRSISFLNKILQIYHFIITIVFYMSLLQSSFMSVTIVILILAPLSLKIAHWIEYKQNNLKYWPINKMLLIQNSVQLDFYLRVALKVIKVDFKDYCESDQSLFLEYFTVEHSVNCEEYPDCFCGKDPEDVKQYLDMRIGKELRLRFLIKYVRQLFFKCIKENLIKNKKIDTGICFSYLYFLIEVYQNKVLCFSEIIRLKKFMVLSYRENALLNQLFQKAHKKFRQSEVSNSLANKKKNQAEVWPSQESNEQKLVKTANYNEQTNVIDYMIGIQFDELVNLAEEHFYTTIQEKQSVLLMLFQDHIDLVQLRDKASNLITLRDKLLKEIISLYKMNQNSQKLLFYTDNFANYLGFGQKKRQIFKKNKSFSYQGLKTDINVFNKNTCVVFITLVNEIGTIRKLQNKFENLFGFPNSKALKKNINILIPTCLQRAHDDVLRDYLKNPENSTRNNFNLLLAQNDQGWAVPVSVKFRPDYINLEDCGLTGFFEKPANEYNYIQLSCGYFQIQCMSQTLFNKVFGALYPQQETYKIYLNRVIPLLNYFEKQQVKLIDLELASQAVQTIAFLPKPEVIRKGFKKFYLTEKLDISDIQQHVKRFSVEYYDIFTVKCRFYYNQFKRIQFNILELHTFKKITNYQLQKESLINFKNQLKTLLNVNIDISNDTEIIDQFIELQNLQSIQGLQAQNDSASEESASDGEHAQYNQNQDQQITDEQLPQMAQRDLILKELYQHHDEETPKNGLIQESHLQVSSQFQLIKYNEISEIIDNRQKYNDISQVKDSDKQDILSEHIQSFNQPMLSPASGQTIPTTVLSPHHIQSDNALFSPKIIPEINLVSQNPIQQKKRLSITEQNNFGLNQQSTMKQQGISKQNSQINIVNSNHKILQEKQKSLEHQASVTSILNEFYDLKQKERIDSPNNSNGIHNGKSPNKLGQFTYLQGDKLSNESNTQLNSNQIKEEDDEDELDRTTQDEKSVQQKIETSTLNLNNKNNNTFNLCQLLKERIRQAKLQLEQQQQSQPKVQRGQSRNTFIQTNSYNSQQRLSVMMQGFGREEENQNYNSNTNIRSNRAINNLPLDKYYTSTKFGRSKTKKQTILSKSQYSRQQILKADDITSEQFSNSLAREEELQREFEQQRSRILAASSVNTNQSQNQEQKKNIYRMVHSKKKNYSLILLMIFGFLALSAFSSLILYQFYQNRSSFNVALLNFQFLPWPLSIRFNYSKVYSDQLLRLMIQGDFIPSFQDNPGYLATVEARLYKSFSEYKQGVLDYTYSDIQDSVYFKYSVDTQMKYVISKDITTIADRYKNITSQKNTINISVAYFILQLIPYIYQTSTGFSKFYSQTILLDNFASFNLNVIQIQTLISQSVIDITQTIKDQALTIMILVITAIIALAFTTLPLYYHIQTKNEELLKLFATISSQSLNDMIQPIQISVMSHKTQTKIKYFQLPIYKKRRTISSCSTIPKIKLFYIFYIVMGIFLMVIQPIISYVYIQSFYQEATVLTELIQNLYNTKAFCTSVQAISNGLILYKSGKSQLYNPTYYSSRAQGFPAQKTQILNSFQQAIETSQKSNRYQNDKYQNFFYKLITEDICESIQNYPEYVSAKNQFDLQRCRQVNSGMLGKGLQLSLKDLFETYIALLPYYNITDSNKFLNEFIKWEKSLNYKEFDEFFTIITQTIEISKDFLLDRINSFMNQMKSIFQSLLIYQLIMMICIFYFGFVSFYFQVQKEMITTKRLLSILSIESILENPYIISFLNKQE